MILSWQTWRWAGVPAPRQLWWKNMSLWPLALLVNYAVSMVNTLTPPLSLRYGGQFTVEVDACVWTGQLLPRKLGLLPCATNGAHCMIILQSPNRNGLPKRVIDTGAPPVRAAHIELLALQYLINYPRWWSGGWYWSSSSLMLAARGP